MKSISKALYPMCLIAIMLTSCEEPAVTPKDPRGENYRIAPAPELSQARVIAMREAQINFAFNSLKALESQDAGYMTSTVSPMAAYMALASVANGAGGATASSFAAAMGADNCNEIIANCRRQIDSFRSLNERNSQELKYYYDRWPDNGSADNEANRDEALKETESFYSRINLATSLWIAPEVKCYQTYIDELTEWLGVSVYELNNNSATNHINEWIAENTNSRIPDLSKWKLVGSVVPVSALYFDSHWSKGFGSISDFIFNNNDGTTSTREGICTTDNLFYASDNTIEIITVPLGCDATDKSVANTMLPTSSPFLFSVILPKNSLSEPSPAINAESYSNLLTSSTKKYITLQLPQIDTKGFTTDASPYYNAISLPNIAGSTKVDFSRLGAGSTILGSILTQTHVKFSSIGFGEVIGKPAISFEEAKPSDTKPQSTLIAADHPFAWVVSDNSTGMILLAGSIVSQNY